MPKKSITIDISDDESENEFVVEEDKPEPPSIEPVVETRPEYDENGKKIIYNKNGRPRKKLEMTQARLDSLQRGRETRARNLALKKEAKTQAVKSIVEEPLGQSPLEKPLLKKVKKIKNTKKVVYVPEESSSDEEQVVVVKRKKKKIKKRVVQSSSSESDTPLKKKSSYTESSYHVSPPEPRYSATQLRYSRMLGI